MAEHDDDQKTESASPRRLQNAWDEGQIPVGRDVLAFAGIAATGLTLQRLGPQFRDSLAQLFRDTAGHAEAPDFSALSGRMIRPALLGLSGCAAAAVFVLGAALVQTQGRVWPELLAPDLSRLWQGKLTRFLHRDFWSDLGISLVKVVTVGWAAYAGLRGDFMTLPALLSLSPGMQLASLFGALAKASVQVLVALAFVAAGDLTLQQLRFRKKLKMTKEEVKREMREDEGDPLIKSRRRRRHRELARGRARIEVPRADALVVNPTHIAIAIRYRKDESKAPRVIAKGKGVLAELMRDLARENGVPIVQDVPLARLLYKKVRVGREVPADTYKAVAAVLAFVYRLTRRQSGSGVRA